MARRRPPAPTSREMSFADYLALPGLNWSTLKHLMKSPRHYRHQLMEPPEDRATLMMGRTLHTAVLEGDRFPLDYAVWTGGRRAGTEWDAFVAANPGRTIIKAEEYAQALAMRDAVREHRVAARLLGHGAPERTITWTDPGTGLACKGRIDWLRPDGFADVKKTAQFEARRFAAQAHDLGYHGQLAWYRRGLRALGMADPVAWLISVEATAPYDVAVWRVDEGVLATGDEVVTRLLNLLVECKRRDKWPGRYPEEQTFFLPSWAYTDPEADEATGLIIGGAA